MLSIEISEHVACCLQLAMLLEVSAYPKPGNVHRRADFEETKYEHFLASVVALAPHFKYASERGIMVSSGEILPDMVGIGELIKDAVRNVSLWQHGGNTLLGTIMLLSPIAVASGLTLAREKFSPISLKKNIKLIVERSTPTDAVAVYDAIMTTNPGGLGKVSELDINDQASRRKILENEISLFDVFKIASKYDTIANEWVNNYSITFSLGYPYLIRQLRKTKDINKATVHTFLKVLSEIPDTLIARKAGLKKAEEVSAQAETVLGMGGLMTQSGCERLMKFDEELREAGHKLNPGTTADITAAILAIAVLEGYRP